MIATILSDRLSAVIGQLNYLNQWELDALFARAPKDILPAIEGKDCYTHIILDYDAIDSTAEEAIQLLARLSGTLSAKLIVIAQNNSPDDVIGNDLHSLSASVIFGTDYEVKGVISSILQRDLPNTHGENTITIMPRRIDAPVTPPSQISRAEAREAIIRKPPIRQQSRASVVAVAGAGPRIGTTTQCLQFAAYLRSQEYKACVVEMHGRKHLRAYLPTYSSNEIELIDEDHFKIMGCDIFDNPAAALSKKYAFDVIVMDYGRMDEILDRVAFLNFDVKVIACGSKPGETDALKQQVYDLDDGTFNYIFFSVPQHEQSTVRELIEDGVPQAYFAPYTPDPFLYCGKDEMYSKILALNDRQTKEKKTSLFGKLSAKFTRKDESHASTTP